MLVQNDTWYTVQQQRCLRQGLRTRVCSGELTMVGSTLYTRSRKSNPTGEFVYIGTRYCRSISRGVYESVPVASCEFSAEGTSPLDWHPIETARKRHRDTARLLVRSKTSAQRKRQGCAWIAGRQLRWNKCPSMSINELCSAY